MRDVAIVGVGQIKVGEHWTLGLRHMALEALQAAMKDAGVPHVDALYVGNTLSEELTGQAHLGALITDFAGLRGIEAMRVEAGGASGSAAVRMGYLAVASGLVDTALVVGVEKMTDADAGEIAAAMAMALDADYEAAQGLSLDSLGGLLMRRYMHEYEYDMADFGCFSVNAHANGMNNPHAMFHLQVKPESYARAPMVADPVNLLDSSPVADGAAAVVLAPADLARRSDRVPVRIAASAVGTDALALHDRRDPLMLEGGFVSTQKAYQQAEMGPDKIDLFELHDAFGVLSALSLEAAGFAERGQGVRLGMEGEIGLQGRIPIATMGGLKARGHPVGATGVYQVVEVVQQLRGQAEANQVPNARVGMAQGIGGSGATVITHILERME